MLHQFLSSFCSVCTKVLLKVAAAGESASVVVSLVSSPAVTEPFVLPKPIWQKLWDPLLDFPNSASFIKREACWVRVIKIASGMVTSSPNPVLTHAAQGGGVFSDF